jgi:hypothetical protein
MHKNRAINAPVKMKYIAIGKDRNTFSSRQATLKLPPKTTKLYD